MTQIKLKHSVVKDKKPTAADLPDFGEVALNAHVDSPGLYTKGSDGSIITLVGSNTSSGDNPLDGRYVQKDGDDMTGDLTFDTDKIVLGADGSAEFKGLVKIDRSAGSCLEIQKSDVTNIYVDSTGYVGIGGTPGNPSGANIALNADGSASFTGNVEVGSNGYSSPGVALRSSGIVYSHPETTSTWGIQVYSGTGGTSSDVQFGVRGDGRTLIGRSDDPVISLFEDGTAEFKSDVAIGDSTTFRGSIGDAVALLPNGIVEQFKTIIDDLPKAQPYGATTLPAELPTPLRDALERVTTGGKINLSADGSAVAGNISGGGGAIFWWNC